MRRNGEREPCIEHRWLNAGEQRAYPGRPYLDEPPKLFALDICERCGEVRCRGDSPPAVEPDVKFVSPKDPTYNRWMVMELKRMGRQRLSHDITQFFPE